MVGLCKDTGWVISILFLCISYTHKEWEFCNRAYNFFYSMHKLCWAILHNVVMCMHESRWQFFFASITIINEHIVTLILIMHRHNYRLAQGHTHKQWDSTMANVSIHTHIMYTSGYIVLIFLINFFDYIHTKLMFSFPECSLCLTKWLFAQTL